MPTPIVTPEDLPPVRGKIIPASSPGASLSALTWFRVGGPADVLFIPADADDLAQFLKNTPADIPVTTIGVGSNLLVRDGGVRGVVVRLGPGFGKVQIDGLQVRAGAAALDAQLAKKAGAAGVGGLEFYRGVPGTIGGALAMNAGAYGAETKDVLIEAVALDRAGNRRTLSNEEMGFTYRHCDAADEGLIFIEAVYQGEAGDRVTIEARMDEIMAAREASQPIKEKTGGSTFANPDPALSGGRKTWQLIDAVGGRGRRRGDAMVSEQHCNFMINTGSASAADLEGLIESLHKDVLTKMGVSLRWEIRRLGEPADTPDTAL